jgi:poly-gamma-glutamate synthesis protein (capsule biosynthesis protein)
MKQNIKTILISIFLSIIIFAVGIFIIKYFQPTKVNNPKENTVKIIPPIKTTLSFVGDIMLTRGVKSSVNKNFGGDYSKLFVNLSELKNSDILMGNLEGDVSDVGNNVGSAYSFRMDPIVLPVLKEAGFDIVSFANNHVGDWNMAAFKDTLSRLNDIGILKSGAGLNKEDATNPTIIEKNGIKFGFLSFSDKGPNWLEAKIDTPGILLANDPNLGDIIKNAKVKCDVLIVSFHWGEEYQLVHNKRQETLAHTAIDNGADVIIGHHPHVMEDTEIYKGKPIVYSLGNFIFDQNFSKDTMRGMVFSLTYDGKNLTGTNKEIITLNKEYQPEGIFSVEEIKKKDELTSSVCPKPQKEYDDMSLLNIGQNIGLPDPTYIPEDLEELDSKSATKNDVCLVEEAKESFDGMVADALEDGYHIKASSGFRSYETQKILFSNAVNSGKADALISLAKPGYSEHQLGTTVDITSASIGYSSASGNFYTTPESLWLKENAYLYGFIQSYPLGKESITGYKSEPWHYRYVGIEKAKEIKDSGLTITGFLNK